MHERVNILGDLQSVCLQRPTCLHSIFSSIVSYLLCASVEPNHLNQDFCARTHTPACMHTLRNCCLVSVRGIVDVNLLSRSYVKVTIPLINTWLYSVRLVSINVLWPDYNEIIDLCRLQYYTQLLFQIKSYRLNEFRQHDHLIYSSFLT